MWWRRRSGRDLLRSHEQAVIDAVLAAVSAEAAELIERQLASRGRVSRIIDDSDVMLYSARGTTPDPALALANRSLDLRMATVRLRGPRGPGKATVSAVDGWSSILEFRPGPRKVGTPKEIEVTGVTLHVDPMISDDGASSRLTQLDMAVRAELERALEKKPGWAAALAPPEEMYASVSKTANSWSSPSSRTRTSSSHASTPPGLASAGTTRTASWSPSTRRSRRRSRSRVGGDGAGRSQRASPRRLTSVRGSWTVPLSLLTCIAVAVAACAPTLPTPSAPATSLPSASPRASIVDESSTASPVPSDASADLPDWRWTQGTLDDPVADGLITAIWVLPTGYVAADTRDREDPSPSTFRRSTDGLDWATFAFPERGFSAEYGMVRDGTLTLIGRVGPDADPRRQIWTSEDGRAWNGSGE